MLRVWMKKLNKDLENDKVHCKVNKVSDDLYSISLGDRGIYFFQSSDEITIEFVHCVMGTLSHFSTDNYQVFYGIVVNSSLQHLAVLDYEAYAGETN